MTSPVLSDFNHWLGKCCFYNRPKSETLKGMVVPTPLLCCFCGKPAKFGALVREHPKAPGLKWCHGVHSGVPA